ncbi:F-box only protein 9-like [Physella acuta]|uniref:F-box only protein 9-like n=1 Tax=Physella acuta TaxID=109671 RepID=UPI0027DC365D|nr:F-box only protein 9-like [Physella acuta]
MDFSTSLKDHQEEDKALNTTLESENDVDPAELGTDEEIDSLFSNNGVADESKEGISNQNGRNSNVNDQLEVFRQQWQNELQKRPESGSQGQSPRSSHSEINVASNKTKQATDLENEARAYFMQGMQAEDDGMLNEAIYYYRKALQLVPDIESRLGSVFTKVPRDRVRIDSESSVEGRYNFNFNNIKIHFCKIFTLEHLTVIELSSNILLNYTILCMFSEIEEDLLSHFEQLRLKDDALCQPDYEQRMTHISCLPIELISYILQWVVSNDLDFRSLEMFSMVCRGFYVCARDERVWKKACEKVWGINVGSLKKYGGSWRRMLIERPHLLFDGCYISKVTYVRQGEESMDSFYRPFHLVEYFRYVRFFPDGQLLMLVTPEDPLQSLQKLRYKNSKTPGILKGVYKLTDHKVACILKRVKTESTMNNRYKRHRQAANQNEIEMTYTVEFDVVSCGRKPNAQLVWCNYAVTSVQKLTGEENISNFDLNKRSFPPLIFSRVRSYTAASSEPLV